MGFDGAQALSGTNTATVLCIPLYIIWGLAGAAVSAAVQIHKMVFVSSAVTRMCKWSVFGIDLKIGVLAAMMTARLGAYRRLAVV